MSEISPTGNEGQDLDIRDTKGRLFRLAMSLAFATLVTVVCMTAMIHDGKGPHTDPMGQASVGLVAIAMFVLTAHLSHKMIVRVHESRRIVRS